MPVESQYRPVPPNFFSDFWDILIEVAKSIDREEIREKISGAFTLLLDFVTHQFLYQWKVPTLFNSTPNSYLDRDLTHFAKRYHWELKVTDDNSPADQNVVTPAIFDVILQEYINYTQGKLPNDLNQVKSLPYHADSQKISGKKFVGSFYTPPNVARFLAQKVLSNYLSKETGQLVKKVVVLDPSMGSGIFLVESARILIKQFTNALPQKTVKENIIEILSNHLFGMDILSEAVQTTKRRLMLWAAVQVSPEELPSLLKGIDFKEHFLCINALTTSVEDVFRIFGQKTFPIIIGNPPFLHTRTGLIDKGIKMQLKLLFPDITKGQWDLCTLFIRRVGDFLAPQGHWGFVLPTRLLSNEHYEPIRRWVIQNFNIRSLVDLGMVFPDAGVEVFLLVAGPRGMEGKSLSFEKFDGSGMQDAGEMPIAQLTRFPFSAIPWLPKEEIRNLVLKINDQPRRLGGLVSITRGFECGFNDISIGTADQLVQRGHSQANLQPIIKGSNIHRFSIVLDTPPMFCVPDWGNPAKYKTPDLFAGLPKIVIRFVANDIVAAIDEIGYMNTNGVYNLHPRPPLKPTDLWWILALLNSSPVSFWFNCIFSNRDKLYPHIQKNQLEAIPIPLLSRREQDILIQISKAQYASAQDANIPFIQKRFLNPLCVAQYLHDVKLKALLAAFESGLDENIPLLLKEMEKQYAPLFELGNEGI